MLKPVKVDHAAFIDGAEHRNRLPSAYNSYSFIDCDPFFAPEIENAMLLLRPLFITAWLIADYLLECYVFGAKQIILSSASSKTAISLAYILRNDARFRDLTVIGLTSVSNMQFVQQLRDCYSHVVPYSAIGDLPRCSTVFIDMAGNKSLRRQIHERFENYLKHSAVVGMTHWQQEGGNEVQSLPGVAPSIFFAPSRLAKRSSEVGMQAVFREIISSWWRFVPSVDSWMKIRFVHGSRMIVDEITRLAAGCVVPDQGIILAMEHGVGPSSSL